MLCIESAKTVNEMTLNKLVKLMTLWITGPWLSFSLFLHEKHMLWVLITEASLRLFYEYPLHIFSWRNKKISKHDWKKNTSGSLFIVCLVIAYLDSNTHHTRADQQITNWQYFSYFSQKIRSDTSCKLSPKEKFAWSVKSYFLGKIRNYISKCCLMKFLPSMQRVKIPVPQNSEGFCATTNNYKENIVRSIGTFTTKQIFTEKWKTERRMCKPLRLPPYSEWATHFRNKRSIGMKFPHAYAYLPFVSCVKVRRKCPNTPLVCNQLHMTA